MKSLMMKAALNYGFDFKVVDFIYDIAIYIYPKLLLLCLRETIRCGLHTLYYFPSKFGIIHSYSGINT